MPARLEDRELAAAVDLEIGVGVAHAVDVTDLPREIEDDLLVAHQILHRAGVAHVGDVHSHGVAYRCNIEQVAPVVGNQRVDEQDVGAQRDEARRQVAADETETSGDQHPPALVE